LRISTILKLVCIATLVTSCVFMPRRPPHYPHLPPTQQPYRVGRHIYYPLPSPKGYSEVGYASWYGKGFQGRPTASGEPYNMYALTAAHKILPMGTHCLVENLENGKRTVVRINDRGPFKKNRIIDLSYSAARRLNMIGLGVAKVRVTALEEGYMKGGRPRFKRIPDFYKGRFFVQVGAFMKIKNARRLKNRLSRHYRVEIQRRWTPKGILFGVQVYGGRTYQGAKGLERLLERRGFPKAFVVAR